MAVRRALGVSAETSYQQVFGQVAASKVQPLLYRDSLQSGRQLQSLWVMMGVHSNPWSMVK